MVFNSLTKINELEVILYQFLYVPHTGCKIITDYSKPLPLNGGTGRVFGSYLQAATFWIC